MTLASVKMMTNVLWVGLDVKVGDIFEKSVSSQGLITVPTLDQSTSVLTCRDRFGVRSEGVTLARSSTTMVFAPC